MTFKFTSTTPTVISVPTVFRRHLSVQVETDSKLYLLMDGDGTVGIDNYTVLLKQGDYWECPLNYKGQVSAVFGVNGGTARVTEHD